MSARWGNSHAIAYEIATIQNPIIGQMAWYCKNVHSRIAQSLYYSFAGPGYHQLIGVDWPLISSLNNLSYVLFWSNCWKTHADFWSFGSFWVTESISESCQTAKMTGRSFSHEMSKRHSLPFGSFGLPLLGFRRPARYVTIRKPFTRYFYKKISWPIGSFGSSGRHQESC